MSPCATVRFISPVMALLPKAKAVRVLSVALTALTETACVSVLFCASTTSPWVALKELVPLTLSKPVCVMLPVADGER